MPNGHHFSSLNEDAPSAPGPASSMDPHDITTLRAGEGAQVTTRKNASHAADLARHNAEKRHASRRAASGRGGASGTGAASGFSSDRLRADASRARRDADRAPEPAGPEGPERTGKNMFIIIGGAIVAFAVLFFVVRCATGLLAPLSEPGADEGQAQQVSEPAVDQTDAGGSVSVNGAAYSLTQAEDGAWAVLDGEGAEVFRLEGTPSTLILYNGMVVIPQSLADGTWDVVAYMPGDGSLPTEVAGADGNPVRGSGTIESAELQGDAVVVADSTGATTSVSLR